MVEGSSGRAAKVFQIADTGFEDIQADEEDGRRIATASYEARDWLGPPALSAALTRKEPGLPFPGPGLFTSGLSLLPPR